MAYTGEARFRFQGPHELAIKYVRPARVLAELAMNAHGVGTLVPSATMSRTLDDGAFIHVSVFEQTPPIITIDVRGVDQAKAIRDVIHCKHGLFLQGSPSGYLEADPDQGPDRFLRQDGKLESQRIATRYVNEVPATHPNVGLFRGPIQVGRDDVDWWLAARDDTVAAIGVRAYYPRFRAHQMTVSHAREVRKWDADLEMVVGTGTVMGGFQVNCGQSDANGSFWEYVTGTGDIWFVHHNLKDVNRSIDGVNFLDVTFTVSASRADPDTYPSLDEPPEHKVFVLPRSVVSPETTFRDAFAIQDVSSDGGKFIMSSYPQSAWLSGGGRYAIVHTYMAEYTITGTDIAGSDIIITQEFKESDETIIKFSVTTTPTDDLTFVVLEPDIVFTTDEDGLTNIEFLDFDNPHVTTFTDEALFDDYIANDVRPFYVAVRIDSLGERREEGIVLVSGAYYDASDTIVPVQVNAENIDNWTISTPTVTSSGVFDFSTNTAQIDIGPVSGSATYDINATFGVVGATRSIHPNQSTTHDWNSVSIVIVGLSHPDFTHELEITTTGTDTTVATTITGDLVDTTNLAIGDVSASSSGGVSTAEQFHQNTLWNESRHWVDGGTVENVVGLLRRYQQSSIPHTNEPYEGWAYDVFARVRQIGGTGLGTGKSFWCFTQMCGTGKVWYVSAYLTSGEPETWPESPAWAHDEVRSNFLINGVWTTLGGDQILGANVPFDLNNDAWQTTDALPIWAIRDCASYNPVTGQIVSGIVNPACWAGDFSWWGEASPLYPGQPNPAVIVLTAAEYFTVESLPSDTVLDSSLYVTGYTAS